MSRPSRHSLETVLDFITHGERLFSEAGIFLGHGTDNYWDEAVLLVCHAIGASPDADRSLLERPVTRAEGARIRALFSRRIGERIPAAYLTGEAWFCRRPYRVDERVLIPRSPFGELIEARLEPWLRETPGTILDLCCGSGCIGIAAAHAFPEAAIVLADIEEGALEVARTNVELHGVAERVRLCRSDGFSALATECFDLILCNPPYVDAGEYADLPDEYRKEPRIALLSGNDGLDFTRMLLRETPAHLHPGGVLFAECGYAALHLVASFPDLPFHWVDLERGGSGVYYLAREEFGA